MAARATRTVKKTPYLIMVRKADWPEGIYQLLPSEVFEKTLYASRQAPEVLKANGVDIPQAVRENGGLRVTVVNFTEVKDYEPSIGYIEKEKDALEVVPLEEGTQIDLSAAKSMGEATSSIDLPSPDDPFPDGEESPEELDDDGSETTPGDEDDEEDDEGGAPADDEGTSDRVDGVPEADADGGAGEEEGPPDPVKPGSPLEKLPPPPKSTEPDEDGSDPFWESTEDPAEGPAPVKTAEVPPPPPPQDSDTNRKLKADQLLL